MDKTVEFDGRAGAGRPDAPALSTAMPLSGDSSCIGRARHHAADFLTRARTRGVAVSARALDLTQLVVSELVTNAVKHAPGPLRLELRIGADATVEVSVQDSIRAQPASHPVDPERVGQHGLEIVKAVAKAFQVRLEPCGKRVTAHIALTD
ncbi:anti-sigma regulatory factor (Ser/Thr protein kinase) [Streptomyces sp. V3I8]|uniref:ATP-binding protein n=1 Tax=Streptomyces sp. V3I8 TaxID=3042279 RepID=UPI002780C970|nr:ATP-binding protein [Streptomyces sp. V3I8]MDQ1033929.1 anti-sigma regulatory factor (Ser/Thr protein kinase) [Streptomyces sp. V3I8]